MPACSAGTECRQMPVDAWVNGRNSPWQAQSVGADHAIEKEQHPQALVTAASLYVMRALTA